jgi:hypothetical protein
MRLRSTPRSIAARAGGGERALPQEDPRVLASVLSADGHRPAAAVGGPSALVFRLIATACRASSCEGAFRRRRGPTIARVGGSGHLGQPYVAGESRRLDRMNESGFWDDAARGICHATDPELRVAAQDRDGIAGEVLYGILGLSDKFGDPEVCRAALAAYNDFLAAFVKRQPRRFAVACLPSGDPRRPRELQRAAELGLAGVELALTHRLMPLWRESSRGSGRLPRGAAPCSCASAHDRSAPRNRAATSTRGWGPARPSAQPVERLAELIFGGAAPPSLAPDHAQRVRHRLAALRAPHGPQ